MKSLTQKLHLKGIQYHLNIFLVNKVFLGTKHFKIKRFLLNAIGYSIGKDTKIVGPIDWHGQVSIGNDCWIGKNMIVNGDGVVEIGDRCDIAPEVTFQTGGHKVGAAERRAGEGCIFHQTVGDGTWIGGRVTILNDTRIGCSCVIASCACVINDVSDNTMVGGVPARVIKTLNDGKY